MSISISRFTDQKDYERANPATGGKVSTSKSEVRVLHEDGSEHIYALYEEITHDKGLKWLLNLFIGILPALFKGTAGDLWKGRRVEQVLVIGGREDTLTRAVALEHFLNSSEYQQKAVEIASSSSNLEEILGEGWETKLSKCFDACIPGTETFKDLIVNLSKRGEVSSETLGAYMKRNIREEDLEDDVFLVRVACMLYSKEGLELQEAVQRKFNTLIEKGKGGFLTAMLKQEYPKMYPHASQQLKEAFQDRFSVIVQDVFLV